MHSCPKELEPYDIAHEKQIKEQDYLQHLWWGNYGLSAVAVAVECVLGGKKAKSKYIEKPVLSQLGEDTRLAQKEKHERDVKKTLLAEEQYMAMGRKKGLPETII